MHQVVLPALPRLADPRRHRLRRRGQRRSPTPWWRSGEPMSTVRSRARGAPSVATTTPSRASAVPRHDRRGPLRVLDPQPGVDRRQSAVLRGDRVRAGPARQAASRASTFPSTKTCSRPTRCCPPSSRTSALRSSQRARPTGPAFDIRLQGEKETVFLASDAAGVDVAPIARGAVMSEAGIDVGLLSPVSVGHDDAGDGCGDPRALVARRGRADPGVRPVGPRPRRRGAGVRPASAAPRSTSGACRGIRRRRQPRDPARRSAQGPGDGRRCREWVHRGATSQDILDSALMLIARGACRDGRRIARTRPPRRSPTFAAAAPRRGRRRHAR